MASKQVKSTQQIKGERNISQEGGKKWGAAGFYTRLAPQHTYFTQPHTHTRTHAQGNAHARLGDGNATHRRTPATLRIAMMFMSEQTLQRVGSGRDRETD